MTAAQILALLTTLAGDYGKLESGQSVQVRFPLNGEVEINVPGVGVLAIDGLVTISKK